MTSSLVGSEMCIRDRGKVFRLLTWNSPEWVWPRGEVDLAQGELAECLPCLLYTSDAADDM
eukprot:448300-Prorocentrum_lima.AAC.1